MRFSFSKICVLLPALLLAQRLAAQQTGPKPAFSDGIRLATQLMERGQRDSFEQAFEQLQKQAAQSKSPEQLAEIGLLRGNYLQYSLQQLDSARAVYLATLARLSPGQTRHIRLALLKHLSHNYYGTFFNAQAVETCNTCIRLADSLGDPYNKFACLTTLGNVEVNERNFDKADRCYRDALQLARLTADSGLISKAYFQTGNIFADMGDLDRSLTYLDSAEMWMPAANFRRDHAELLFWKGLVHAGKGDYARAIQHYKAVLPTYAAFKDTLRLIHVQKDMSDVLLKTGKHTEAIQVAEQAFSLINNRKAHYEKQELFKILYEAHKTRGDFAKALRYHEQWQAIKDTIAAQNHVNALAYMEARHQLTDKQQQIEQQQKQKNIYRAALMLAVALCAALLYFYRKAQKTRRELAAKNALVEQQRAELLHLDGMKSRFFANVSHELRTPLTLILGPLASALKSGELGNRNFTLLKKAQQSGQELLKLVSEILDLSKLESGKLELRTEKTLLLPFVRRVVSQFESHAEMRQLRLTLEFLPEKNLQIITDPAKLENILNNLLSNAIKFTPPEGAIAVRVEDLGHSLRFAVADTGRGIHPDDLPRIFDRFYQTARPDAAAEGGTGIGLALCRELAELFGGRIWAESPASNGAAPGSVFYFELPKKEVFGMAELPAEPVQNLDIPHEAAPLAPAPRPATAGPEKRPAVLVVEDNPSLREYIQFLLSEKYRVFTAENGRDALAQLRDGERGMRDGAAPHPHPSSLIPDLIVSDLMMPLLDGYQLLEALKSDLRLRQIPVVMLTARADVRDKLKALRIGVDDYLLKPFDEEELLARVENLLANARNRAGFVEPAQPEAEEPGGTPPPENIISEADAQWLQTLESQVQRHLTERDFGTERMGAAMNLSTRQLQRNLQRLTGLSPGQYLREARLQHARHLLETDRRASVKSVALTVGWSDVEYFAQQFRQRFGKLPSELRG